MVATALKQRVVEPQLVLVVLLAVIVCRQHYFCCRQQQPPHYLHGYQWERVLVIQQSWGHSLDLLLLMQQQQEGYHVLLVDSISRPRQRRFEEDSFERGETLVAIDADNVKHPVKQQQRLPQVA